jgi:hypothetical protein
MSQKRASEVEREVIARLPGMRIREWAQAPYDWIFEPQNQKIEHKYSGEKRVEHRTSGAAYWLYNGDVTLRYCWTDIADREFDWLLLIGEDEDELHFWLLPEMLARAVMNPSGQITFVHKNKVARKRKARMIDARAITLEQLRTRCEQGRLKIWLSLISKFAFWVRIIQFNLDWVEPLPNGTLRWWPLTHPEERSLPVPSAWLLLLFSPISAQLFSSSTLPVRMVLGRSSSDKNLPRTNSGRR